MTGLLGVGGLAVLGLPVVTLAGVGGALALGQAPASAAATCVQAGTTGLSAAKVVSTSTSTLTGTTITAKSCDVGLYVGPTAKNVTIKGVTVTGANDEGILVQNSTDVTVEDSVVKGDGTSPTPAIAFDNALELIGTSNSKVEGNTLSGDFAGGIGVADDGPTNPGGPKPSTLRPSNNDVISGNTISAVYGGCSIVFSSRNPGAGITGGAISHNTLTGSPGHFGPHGPVIGNIVVATAGVGASLSGVAVTGNTVTGAGLPGIIVHGDAPGSKVSAVTVAGNTLSGDDWLTTDGPAVPAGIVVATSPIPPPGSPVVTGTSIKNNTVSNEFYDVWTSGATGSAVGSNTFSVLRGGTEAYSTPIPGSGYWELASDGGVFTFGSAGFYGSAAGRALGSPVVGMAPTFDQGGYWLAEANGAVSGFGDAANYGSMAGKSLGAPIVGIAPTPYIPSSTPGGTPTPDGKGYWLVGQDGGVFTFGDAKFYGSLPGMGVHVSDIVGMVATPDGHGYWLVRKDGGVFSFGDAGFYGSLPGMGVHVSDVVGILATPDGHGYWLVGKDGGVFSFGDAGFYGSLPGMGVH
ncbi:MAG: right-handed parallel beta-helix repeat-containing protein, partial [Actinomycetota bacterium]|nr:right-handed parallel beta-helix repeat-containing protein [Actinomycetota bacterium]